VTDALNAAKKNRCTSLIYCQEIEQQKTFQKQVAQIIKQLKDGENSHNSGVPFFLKYQPKVNALTNVITGWEALCRLEIPNLGVVSPNYFIRLAEEENLIWYIDMWVVKEVCRQVKVWGNQGYHLPVSLNLSRYYMNQSDVVDAITAIFSEIDYYEYRHLIQFEITETGVFNQQCLKTISDLNQKLGIKFIIDDVGMQQANLYTLLTLYINGLIESVKIDKIYAAKILQHDEQGKLILDKEGKPYLDNEGCKYIISLLRSFDGLFTLPDQPRPPVLCEGVEYREQVEWLLKNGCHIMQGFYFGKPIPVHECLRFLK
jgi:EAL domain-containing protein (putative c-di-GMP-specific phosphodiesterase class I)